MGVPRTIDFANTDEDRQVMELVYSQAVFGRPYVLPPGVPAERVAALRKAFMAAIDRSGAARRGQEGEARYRGALRRRGADAGRALFAMPKSVVEKREAVADLQAGEIASA